MRLQTAVFLRKRGSSDLKENINGSLSVKNGVFYAIFSYKDWKGKYRTKWYSTGIKAKGKMSEREARKRLKELREQFYTDREKLENPQKFVVLYMTEWLKEAEDHVDIITYRSYKQHIEKHLIPYFEPLNLKLSDVTRRTIEDYYRFKSTGGRLDGKPGGLSRSTIKRHSVVLNQIFTDAVMNGLIDKNPCEYARIPLKRVNTVQKYYTVEQCKKLLEATLGQDIHDMIEITVLYGLRRSEMLGLRWRDIDFESGKVYIRHTRVATYGTPIAKDSTKNKTSNRIYPLLSSVRAILEKIRARQEDDREFFGDTYFDSDYVFTHEDGTPYHPDFPSKKLRKVIRSKGFEELNWHGLRHSCASMLAAMDWQPKAIADWLGHSDIRTSLDIYTHTSISHKAALGETLEGVF